MNICGQSITSDTSETSKPIDPSLHSLLPLPRFVRRCFALLRSASLLFEPSATKSHSGISGHKTRPGEEAQRKERGFVNEFV